METNREALRRLGEEAREDIAKQPSWMRTPPREPVIWRERGKKPADEQEVVTDGQESHVRRVE